MNNTTSLYQDIELRMAKSTSDSCETSTEESEEYNLTMRIVSIFVLLVISFIASGIPIASTRVKCLRISPIIINTGKFFGTGVILATAFIHILPSAMNAFTDECLPESWKDYEAYAGVFAMVAILAMQLIEFIAHHHIHETSATEQPVFVDQAKTQSTITPVENCEQHGHSHGSSLLQEGNRHRISTYLVEFGIAIHSVLIGLALGTEAGSDFVALFIAICFHQFFEAIALGAQISKINHKSILPAVVMVIIFSITTPVGVAIGIGIHLSTANTKSEAALVSTGILDAIASGILIYAALVNLIAAEMSAGAHEFFKLKKRLKFLYFVALYLGAAFMAILGKWA